MKVLEGWRRGGVGALLWPPHSWSAAAAADWTPGLPTGTSPASWSQAWQGLDIRQAILGA